MPGTLYVVATPIGNLEDVTLRALRVLREVTVIAAEDTRRTARLLQHYSISTPTTSLHEHNEHARTPVLIGRLTGGDSVALVSDAGTPAISDPGARLVAAAHAAGIRVEPVPGPSAVTAVVSASGIATDDGFIFAGFAPAKAGRRKTWLQSFDQERRPFVCYEAPHRILALLGDIKSVLGNRLICVAREITKLHEELAVRPINVWLESPPEERGEFVVVVAPADPQERQQEAPAADEVLADFFWHLTESGGHSRRSALKAVAETHGVTAREVFNALERTKKLGD